MASDPTGVAARWSNGRAGLVAAVPVLLALAAYAAISSRVPLGGDEPHYLIIADSLLRDYDLRLQNNYERDAATQEIFGRVEPHVYRIPEGWAIPAGWWPYHGVGLPFLVALPFALGGVPGARVAVCLLTGLMGFAIARWLASLAGDLVAGWATIGAMVSLPVLFGSTQIFPDLPGGVAAAVLACWLLMRLDKPQRTRAWPIFWLAAGLLPWLHVKFAGATLVLAAAGAGLAWHYKRRGDQHAARTVAMSMPLILVGVGGLAAWHLSISGSVLGFRRTSTELTGSPARALMIFLGLHFDKAQGMFFAQPLLLSGVASLVPFVRSRPRVALVWAALYLSLIVPNALELARYGLGGPAGRFGWSAMWLWLVPVGFVLARYGARAQPIVRRLALAGILYQAALAARWIPHPNVLWTNLKDAGWSVFPRSLAGWLPSFATWDFVSYLRSPVNGVAMAAVLALAVAGARLLGASGAGEGEPVDARTPARAGRDARIQRSLKI
jgi:hypothetical protein